MTVRVGFVGTGGRAVGEILDLVQMQGVEIAALCDLAPERCQQAVDHVAKRLGPEKAPTAPHFTDYRQMLESVPLDAVYVSLPPFAHGEIEHAVIEAGKALCVEKPVALTPEVAHEVEGQVKKRGVVSSVAYQVRYGSAIQAAKEILAGREIGMVMAIRMGGLPPVAWWRVQDKSGGMLVEQHTHGVDLMRYIAGEIETVYAEADTRLLRDVPGLDIHDVNAATVRFASGAVGCIVNSCAVPQGNQAPLGNGIHFIAKDVTVSLSILQETVVVWADGRREVIPEGKDYNYRFNQAFIHAVATGDRSGILSDYSDGVRTFEVTHAALRSAQTHEVVRVGAEL